MRSRIVKVLLLLTTTCLLYGFLIDDTRNTRVVSSVIKFYASHLDTFESNLVLLEKNLQSSQSGQIRKGFKICRAAYKKIEFLVEYHYPSTALRINGPALLEAEPSEPNEPQHPSGLQLLEEYIYDDDTLNASMIIYEISNIKNRVSRLKNLVPELELTEATILDALRLNLVRLITKGITGFDSPVALASVEEAANTISGFKDVIGFFPDANSLVLQSNSTLSFIKKDKFDFDSFDRAAFIRKYINPLTTSLYNYQVSSKIPFVEEKRAIDKNARTIFDRGAFDVLFYAPSGTATATTQQIDLGKRLFAEPMLSSTGKRSCKTCHEPSKSFTDGLALNESLNANTKLLRNTPSLINAALQSALFYDSHISFLEDQAHDVISNRNEMGGSFETITDRLRRNKYYKNTFRSAYSDAKIAPENIKLALAAYVRSLVRLNSPFDRYMRGDSKAMNPVAIKGFNLFMGKAKCGTCHFMPLFSGNVPPLYDKMESEVIGVPANRDTINVLQDMDSGKYHLYSIPHQLFSFKTPSIRNAAFTAPYMHNGVYQTLDEVIDFYDRGGGVGLGLKLNNQTLPADRLNLSKVEKQQLIAFIKSLSDINGQ